MKNTYRKIAIKHTELSNLYHSLAQSKRACWLNAESFSGDDRRKNTLSSIVNLNISDAYVIAPSIDGNYGQGDVSNFETMVFALKSIGCNVHAWICSKKRTDNQAEYRDESEQLAQSEWSKAIFNKWPFLDGLHLDYIRYSWEKANPEKIEAITRTVSLIRSAIPTDSVLSCAVFSAIPTWSESYKDIPIWSENVPDWYRNWYMNNPGSIYDGAMTENGEKYIGSPKFFKYQQNPTEWLADIICPMEYTNDIKVWNEMSSIWSSFTNKSRLKVGVNWSGIQDANLVNSAINLSELKNLGIAIFDIGIIEDDELWD